MHGLIKVTAILYIFMYSRMGREIFPMTYALKFFLGSQDAPPVFFLENLFSPPAHPSSYFITGPLARTHPIKGDHVVAIETDCEMKK